jgi:transposase
MAKPKPIDPKEQALRAHGALHRHPVSDEGFVDNGFFDPRDVVQVRYEMLRKVAEEGASVSGTARGFGFSRLTYYKIRAAFAREGVVGLLPKKRGPRGAHKLTDEVLAYVEAVRAEEEQTTIGALVERIEERFGVRVHRRSLERALGRRGKKTP